MKSIFYTLLLFAVFANFVSAQNEDKTLPSIDDGSPVKHSEKSFYMALVGDSQRYSKTKYMQPIFTTQIEWLARRAKILDLKCAFFTGDFVEFNAKNDEIGGYSRDQSSQQMWNFIDRSFNSLDGKILYIPSAGNHDYGVLCAENRNSEFPRVFNAQRNPLNKNALVECFKNAKGVESTENACWKIDCGGLWGEIIVFTLEFNPRDEAMDWIKKTASEKFADKTVFLLLHNFISTKGRLTNAPKFWVESEIPERCGGKKVWEYLVCNVPNIRLVMCGHAGSKDWQAHANTFFMSMKNKSDKDVYVMEIANHGVAHEGAGADGWLRLLEFMPDGKTIKATTFSPFLNLSPLTKHLAWCKSQYAEFEFEIK